MKNREATGKQGEQQQQLQMRKGSAAKEDWREKGAGQREQGKNSREKGARRMNKRVERREDAGEGQQGQSFVFIKNSLKRMCHNWSCGVCSPYLTDKCPMGALTY